MKENFASSTIQPAVAGGALKSAGMIIAAPFAGLAFVVVAPVIGLFILLPMGIRAFAKDEASGKMVRFAKNVALFLVSPFLGLAYLASFPLIGMVLAVRMGLQELEKHKRRT